ncbi:S8 family serine peptidase [Micromonospora endolithica]|uniref:S8 family serine peptidase n=1 Tax=Micromonospora endolithica TaxID=230091 RepID=UPI0011ACE40E|nr:S8 family serine peptidase [Micromonospora endolithica]TWJ24943.1 subtilisin family serine protease [Micromonospora endolithica]
MKIRRGVLRRTAVAGLALATLTTVTTTLAASPAMAEPTRPDPAKVRGVPEAAAVPDQYIVVLKDKKAKAVEVKSAASALAEKNGGTVRKVFSKALNGYSAKMTKLQAARLAADPDVAYVEQVQRVFASDTQSNPPSWGLDRIDQVRPVFDRSYTYATDASDVTAYIVDTGMDIAHRDFGGRASHGYDFIDNDAVADDPCDGHGTHVAGTVGGTKYGVAKNVKLVALRVIGCPMPDGSPGSGTTVELLAAIDWIATNADGPSVVNMSLGFGGRVTSVEDAISASIAKGIHYVVAAGNEDDDACRYTPAAVPGAITVGATDRFDFRADFSNFGRCVDVFAPGVAIHSSMIGPNAYESAIYSGTSMASPHVAGAAALLLAQNPTWTPQQVRDRLVTRAVSGAVHDPRGALDRLLHVGDAPVARSSFGLRARSNGKVVAAESGGTKPLVARSSALGPWEKLDVVDAGSGYVALKARVNGKFVAAESAGAKPLIARSAAVGPWEKFQLLHNSDGSVSLKAVINGKFVTAANATSPLIASKTSVSTAEKFDFEAPNPIVSIKAHANNKFVVAESAGAKPLIARSATVRAWEQFELVRREINESGFRYYVTGFRALINGKFVKADSAGAKPLIANGAALGEWESFYVHDNLPDGSVKLVAWIDGEAVKAEGGGTRPLIANRWVDWSNDKTLGLGQWESFTISAI